MSNKSRPAKTGLLRKGDLILIVVILLVAAALLFFHPLRRPGTTVTVTVDGNFYGSWNLAQNAEITIPGHSGTNLVRIADGTASVISADCPDLLCVHHAPITNSGERIVCLPNRVIVSIDAKSDSSGPDAVSQ